MSLLLNQGRCCQPGSHVQKFERYLLYSNEDFNQGHFSGSYQAR